MTDYTKMTASEMLQDVGDDAQKWAAAFCQTAEKLGHHGIDEGWMIGWFANAIEQSTAVRSARTPAPEGEASLWGCADGNGIDPRLVFRDRPTAEHVAADMNMVVKPLYASPVVPVGNGEVIDREWLIKIIREHSFAQDAAAAILAALRPTDTGADAWAREICTGCTSSITMDDIKARGIVSCCPERKMVTIEALVRAYESRPVGEEQTAPDSPWAAYRKSFAALPPAPTDTGRG